MPVRLRFQRLGRNKRAFYRLVAADSRSPRDGKFLEAVSCRYALLRLPYCRLTRNPPFAPPTEWDVDW